MIAVVQRVAEALVIVESEDYHAAIGPGLCVLLGIEQGDADADAAWMAGKLARLRIFSDADGKMNLSVQDVGGELLLVSQFTLAGDCEKGNRPSFAHAAAPAEGERLYEAVAELLREPEGVPVRTGIYGAMMQVNICNDGPVTLIIRRQPSS